MMIEALERQDSGVLLLLLGRWDEGQKIIGSGDELFQENYKIAKSNITVPGEGELIEKINQQYMIYKDNRVKPIVGTGKQGNLDWYFRNLHMEFLEVKGAVNELKELNEKTLYRTASDLKNRANRAVMPGTVAVIAALIFSLMFTYFVNLYMITPIRRMIRGIEDFIKKDRDFDVSFETHDEMSRLSSAIQSLCSRVSSPVEKK